MNEADIEKAVQYLVDSASKTAQDRANRLHMEEYRKSLKALLMRQWADLALSAQERNAYAHPKYTQHLEALKTAIEIDEKNRYLRSAAEAKIKYYQTLSANTRKV